MQSNHTNRHENITSWHTETFRELSGKTQVDGYLYIKQMQQ